MRERIGELFQLYVLGEERSPKRRESKSRLSVVEPPSYHPRFKRVKDVAYIALLGFNIAYSTSFHIKPDWPDRLVQNIIESLPLGK